VKKRILAILLALVLFVSILSGCGGTEDPADNGDTGDKATNDPVKTTEESVSNNFNETGYPIVNEKITFTVMHPQNPTNGPMEDMIYFQKLEEASNIGVVWEPVPASDWDTKPSLTLAGGDLPDIVMGAVSNSTVYEYGIIGDYIVEISEGIDKYMPNLKHWLNEYPDVYDSITQIDGSIYFAPYIYDTAQAASDTVYLRMDFLRKAGIDKVPTTVDEFYDMLTAFKEANFAEDFAPMLPYRAANLTTGAVAAWLYPAFGESYDIIWGLGSEGKVEYTMINDQYKLYIEFISKLYAEGLIEPEIFTMDDQTNIAKMRENKGAVLTYATQLNPENFESGEYEVEIIPPLVSGHTSTQKIRSMPHYGGSAAFITKECEHVEAALRWFDMGYSVEDILPGLNHLSGWLGIRGYNWDFTDETKQSVNYFIPEDLKEEAGNKTEAEFRVYRIAPSMGPRAAVLWFIPESGGTKMKSEQSIMNLFPYMKESFPASALKFTEEENDVISNRFTDIETYVNQKLAKFIVGDEPMSNWDNYVAEVKRMGIDEVIEVYQASYDRLLESRN
jgi:putative aldouronate transport system substrate-binding protein